MLNHLENYVIDTFDIIIMYDLHNTCYVTMTT